MASNNFSGLTGLHDVEVLNNGFYKGYDTEGNLWFVQPDYKDGINLEMYIHGDGANSDGNVTDCEGNGSHAIVETMEGNNPPQCTVCIYGSNTIGTMYNEGNHYKAIDDMGDRAYGFIENNGITINKCNYELFSAGGNFGLEALEKAIKEGHIPVGASVSLTANDAEINPGNVNMELLKKWGVFMTFVGNKSGQQNTYAIAQRYAQKGFNTQHISIPNGLVYGNGASYHQSINNFSIASGIFAMMLGLNNVIGLNNNNITLTVFDDKGNAVQTSSNLKYLEKLVARANGAITNDVKIVNDLVSNITSCLSRATTIPKITVNNGNDPTGIKGFANGYIDNFNTMKNKLYENMQKECNAIKSYSDALNNLDLNYADLIAAAAGISPSATTNTGGTRHRNGYTGGGYTGGSSNSNPTPSSNDTPSNGKDPALLDVDLKDIDVNYLLNKDITKRAYDITAEDLDRLFAHWAEMTGDANSPAIGQGAAFIEASRESGIDPLVLVGICGKETGRAKSGSWIDNNNFFGIKYIHLDGRSVKYGGENHLFDTPRESIIACAKHIKEFYYDEHGGHTVAGLAATGYNGGNSDSRIKYGRDIAAIMKESLDYIVSTKTTTQV